MEGREGKRNTKRKRKRRQGPACPFRRAAGREHTVFHIGRLGLDRKVPAGCSLTNFLLSKSPLILLSFNPLLRNLE